MRLHDHPSTLIDSIDGARRVIATLPDDARRNLIASAAVAENSRLIHARLLEALAVRLGVKIDALNSAAYIEAKVAGRIEDQKGGGK